MCFVFVASIMAEADSLMTWFRDGAVKLRMTDSGLGAEPPMTLNTLFKETVDRYPDRIALCELHVNYNFITAMVLHFKTAKKTSGKICTIFKVFFISSSPT